MYPMYISIFSPNPVLKIKLPFEKSFVSIDNIVYTLNENANTAAYTINTTKKVTIIYRPLL